MSILADILGIVLILAALLDGFETVVLPRRIRQRVRLASFYYKMTWQPYRVFAHRIKDGGRREGFLSFYGPLSLILLIGVWALFITAGFGFLYWGLGSPVHSNDGSASDFFSDLYLSGTTFFTLGLGDLIPDTVAGRVITVLEAGLGFSFLALIIGYLPALNGAFGEREVSVSLLDGRAGSPPSAVALLAGTYDGSDISEIKEFLRDWERWSAELLESHLSFPVLSYFRSQHEHESWVASLTVVLDVCALVISGGYDGVQRQAELTFAIARHASVDLSQIFGRPTLPDPDRLSEDTLKRVVAMLNRPGILKYDASALNKLADLRRMYEPYVNSLSEYLLMSLPPWTAEPDALAAWETSAWEGTLLREKINTESTAEIDENTETL